MKLTFKNIIKTIEYIGLILFIIFVCLYFFRICSTEPTPPHSNKDSLNTIIAEKEQIADSINNRIDTVEIVRNKILTKYKTIYDTIIKQAPDTCKTYLIALDKECSIKDSINEVQLTNYSNLTDELTGIIALQKTIIKSDSLTINELTMTVKKEKRKGKLKTILGTALGFIGGGLIGSLR